MPQANPFADLIPAQPAQPLAAPPARIYGGPKPVDPMEQQRFQLSVKSDERADRSAERQDAAAARAADAADRQAKLDAAKLGVEGRLTESEGKTTAFFNRALGADRDFAATSSATHPRGVLAQGLADHLPTGLVNSLTSDDRQKAEQAKHDFIAASLRYESGAAIGKDEFDKQDQTFFPQPGDGEAVISQKAAARQRVIESFRISAGAGAARVGQPSPNAPTASANGIPHPQNREAGGALTFNDQVAPAATNAMRLSDTQAQQLQELAQTGASTDQLAKLVTGFGRTPDAEGLKNLEGIATFYAKPENRRTPLGVSYQRDGIRSIDPGDGTVGAIGRGITNAGTLGFGNRLGAIADTVGDGGTYAENLDRRRGYDAYDEENNAGARFAGQVVGGLALPVVGGTGAANLARNGAAYGGIAGLGNSYGDGVSRLTAAGTGAIAGGALGYGLGRAGEYLASRTPQGPRGPSGGVNQDVVDAAERQGVEIVRPDADPTRRSTYGFLETLPGAGGRVRADLQRGANQIENRVAEVGGNAPIARPAAGDVIREAGQRYTDRSRTVVNRLYDRAATLSGNARIDPRSALNTLDTHIASLQETPNANRTKLDVLNQIRADLVDDAGNPRSLSIQGLRDLRTAARDELGAKGLRYSDTERRVTDAINSASQDIRTQLSGPALRAYDRADRSYRERADLVDNVVEKFIGNDRRNPRSGEAIMSAVESAAAPKSGNAAALERLTQRLEPNERNQVASTIAAQLGRRGTDGDNAFTPNLFFSQIQKFSPEARAAIWGQQGARDLADLATISQARAGTLGMLNNSRSGQAGNWFKAIQAVLSGGGAGAGVGAAVGGVAGAGAGASTGLVVAPALLGGAYATARSLGSPRVVSALAQAARATTPPAQVRVVRLLGQIAARQPQIANDILPIQRALQEALPRAAAQSNDEQDRR